MFGFHSLYKLSFLNGITCFFLPLQSALRIAEANAGLRADAQSAAGQ